jgi:hypothetical protein
MIKTRITAWAVAGVTAAAIMGAAAPASAQGCYGGGFAVGGVCCAYNVYSGNFVATGPGGNFIGDCNGGVRTPPWYNTGRGPND